MIYLYLAQRMSFTDTEYMYIHVGVTSVADKGNRSQRTSESARRKMSAEQNEEWEIMA